MKVFSRVNNSKLNQINSEATMALIKTGDALKTDLIQSQTMPFKTGELQNRSTFVDSSEASTGVVKVISDTPYARRLYFHPEYNFNRSINPNAGGMWFEPYIGGNKKDFAKNTFERFMRGKQ